MPPPHGLMPWLRRHWLPAWHRAWHRAWEASWGRVRHTRFVGRGLRLSIWAVLAWLAVDAVWQVTRATYHFWLGGYPDHGIDYAIRFATGTAVSADGKVLVNVKLPPANYPPSCRELYEEQMFASCYSSLSGKAVPGAEDCDGVFDFGAPCYRYVYLDLLFEHKPTLDLMIDAVRHPCRYLPSPEVIAAHRQTSPYLAGRLNEAWKTQNCDRPHVKRRGWVQLGFRPHGRPRDIHPYSILITLE